MGAACRDASRVEAPWPHRLHHPEGVQLVPGEAPDNLLRELDQRLTDRDLAHRDSAEVERGGQ